MNILASNKHPVECQKARVDIYDIVKGIGILLVVSAHIFENSFYYTIVYAFHMPLFLIVSGMLIDLTKSSQKPFRKLLSSKFKSLMIPYIVTELICIPLFYFRGGYQVSDITWILIDSVFLYESRGSATWFLLSLFITEIIYYVLLKCIRNKYAVIAISVFGFIISLTIPVSNHHLWLLMRSLNMMFFVMVGHQFALFFKKRRKFIINLILVAVFLFQHY